MLLSMNKVNRNAYKTLINGGPRSNSEATKEEIIWSTGKEGVVPEQTIWFICISSASMNLMVWWKKCNWSHRDFSAWMWLTVLEWHKVFLCSWNEWNRLIPMGSKRLKTRNMEIHFCFMRIIEYRTKIQNIQEDYRTSLKYRIVYVIRYLKF